MPFPREHSCRLRDPATVKIVGSQTRKHKGKSYRILFGIPTGGGGSVEQAYRYDRKTWTAAAAGAHCRAHKGRFEAAVSEAAIPEAVGFAALRMKVEWSAKVHQLMEQGYPVGTARAMAARMIHGKDE